MEAERQPHFGAQLRRLRLDAGMTQQELAERANLSVEAIGQLERGTRTRPHRDTLILLAQALELSLERAGMLHNAAQIGHRPRYRERA
ncbi:MAG: helix-turn-helix transcriptional regulator, partial [Candidatus Eremiobacteraeota bacterium]|nr:helix-turn-helix transcriptional regulator [Candidatus Eremiobacteraeota bacterium]